MNKNKEQDVFQGFFGIFNESIKLILTWPKIFIQITLVSIFPQSCIFLLDNWVFMPHYNNVPTLGYNHVSSPWYTDIFGSISKEMSTFLLIKTAYFIFSIIFSMISISTIVYTVSCIYTNQEITFKRIISVVPRAWKPFLITYMCRYCMILEYMCILLIWAILFISFDNLGNKFFFLGIQIYLVGLLYMSITWQLADAISIMEKTCGFKALKKSRRLIKGKMGTALAIFFVTILCVLPILALKINEQLVENKIDIGKTLCSRIFIVVWWSLVSLFVLVAQAVFYFVCKSYHHEDIDNLSIGDDHQVYIGEYVPLKADFI